MCSQHCLPLSSRVSLSLKYDNALKKGFKTPIFSDISSVVALVSGAGNGIGQEIALQLAELGCRVACVHKDKATSMVTVDKIKIEGGQESGFVCDIRDKSGVSRTAEQVKELGQVTILVNNAVF